MSRQIMKDLQHRAQLLLEASSEEEDEVNAYTASPSRSRPTPRIDINHLIGSQDDSDDQEVSPSKPDIQLLKKCISLTNENNQLRALTNQQQNKINHLQKLIEQLEQVEYRLKQKQREEQVVRREQGWEESEFEKQMAGLRLENMQLKHEGQTLRSLNSQLERQLQENRVKGAQESPKDLREIAAQNDYTIKFKSHKPPTDFSALQQQYQERIARAERQFRQEKSKTHKLCQFINLEIPKLQSTIQELTLKLELRVDKYLLRDSSPH